MVVFGKMGQNMKTQVVQVKKLEKQVNAIRKQRSDNIIDPEAIVGLKLNEKTKEMIVAYLTEIENSSPGRRITRIELFPKTVNMLVNGWNTERLLTVAIKTSGTPVDSHLKGASRGQPRDIEARRELRKLFGLSPDFIPDETGLDKINGLLKDVAGRRKFAAEDFVESMRENV
jgi:hypothetical protein